ncbi:MAG: redoxin domain-containing protein [Deltaproteobacteria bacterium]|nr:redoxin domain-containing protein [Deltaproteobacteria bacterium]NIS77577.1 redoxin domain-containing protein [Deltaproteobacteria bacterium]
MSQKTTVVIAALIVAIAGGYIFLKQRPLMIGSPGKESRGGHPPVLAPRFELEDISGEKINLADFQGKAVVLNFFATWCPPCQSEIPGFVNIYKEYKSQGLEIIGISLDNDPETVLPEFISEYKIPYTVAIGSRDMISMYGGLKSLPTTIFINRKGEITNVHMGFLDETTFEEEAKKIL